MLNFIPVPFVKAFFIGAAFCVLVLVYLCQVKAPLWRNLRTTESPAHLDDDNNARRTIIKSVCERHHSYLPLYRPSPGLGTNVPSPNEKKAKCSSTHCPLFVDDSRSLAFCSIPKVASTTLKGIFAPLLNVKVPDGSGGYALYKAFSDQVLHLGPTTLLQHSERRNYTKALFVRHPFERIVSTYIDKALRGRKGEPWAYKAYWNTIPGVRAENRSPTFSEFVEFMLRTTANNSDEHWSPYYARCHPCLLDYDFVGKLETADRDFPLFFSLVGIAGKADVHRHDNSRHNVTGVNVTDAKYYFNQLSFDQVMRLYTWYFYDFELFGYDFRDYLP
ncbi:hypothetical protein HPB50_006195 [Hyalomma asiaticum]|uniref:Uncharacterized protein n=1 Tax=Hyalomma asiaticum TaxID=266040 RepID=A0ACB7RVT0_HYAAI|nr:hypothetical protein HPB50_006195 [Hyalomma asiaticum]